MTTDLIELQFPAAARGLRLDQALASALPQFSRSRLKIWIDAGLVLVDDELAEPKQKVRGGEHIALTPVPELNTQAFSPEAIALKVVFEDATLLVINKPAGMVVHPAVGNWSGTLLNALLHHVPHADTLPRAGIVHRLDKDTSGLLVVAKTIEAQTDLVRQLQARTVKREYLAVAGGIVAQAGSVDAPIGRHPKDRVKMAVVEEERGGKAAVTHYAIEESFTHNLKATLLRCALQTGRTHQIRVHLAYIGHALLGDQTYAGKVMAAQFHRQALHATKLGLIHPKTGKPKTWEAAPPADFADLLTALRKESAR